MYHTRALISLTLALSAVDHAKLAATLFGSGAQPISPQPSPVSMGSPSPAFKMPGAESPAAEKEHPSPAPFKFGQGGSLWGGSQAPKQGLFGQTNEPASADPKSSAGTVFLHFLPAQPSYRLKLVEHCDGHVTHVHVVNHSKLKRPVHLHDHKALG